MSYEELTENQYQSNLKMNPTYYCELLAKEAEIENIPYVIMQIAIDSVWTQVKEPLDFRKYRYIIIDDKKFRKVKYEN